MRALGSSAAGVAATDPGSVTYRPNYHSGGLVPELAPTRTARRACLSRGNDRNEGRKAMRMNGL